MTTLESILVLITYCLAYGAAVLVVASIGALIIGLLFGGKAVEVDVE